MENRNGRIWELDMLRGVFLMSMLAIHITYDLVYLFGVVTLKHPALFAFSQNWGGTPFLFLSGICATLGARPVRRGLQVLSCALVISAVTAGMYLLGFAGVDIIIYFGVLHCLGICMLLWTPVKKLPAGALACIGLVLAGVGLYLNRCVRVDFDYLVPLGLFSYRFASSDYFPLLPNLGYFLIGGALGKTLYRAKKTRFPGVNTQNSFIRFFCYCGKHSLPIYMIHQPIIAGIIALVLLVLGRIL